MYQLKQLQEGVPRKKLLQKLDKKKGEEWYIDNHKNIEKLLPSRLLDFLLFITKRNQGNFIKILTNVCEKIILEKFQVYSLQM